MESDDKNIDSMIYEIKKNQELSRQLVEKLERSVAIKKLWPEAFDSGSCTSYWLGRYKNIAANITFIPTGFVIYRSDGVKKQFETEDVLKHEVLHYNNFNMLKRSLAN